MKHRDKLLYRLDQIGAALEQHDGALALVGLGSCGLDTDRLDAYSDLDFFVIAAPGHKAAFVEDLGWLGAICPLVYTFRNTPDGYKCLFEDDIFAEFAIFEPDELARIPFAEGRVVWAAPGFNHDLARPRQPQPVKEPPSPDWSLNEALTNCYIGLCRYRRGERLSAARFVQVYAVERVMELAAMIEPEQDVPADAFAPDRRFEARFPQTGRVLADLMPGYEHTPQAARQIVAYLEQHFEVNQQMKALILKLAA